MCDRLETLSKEYDKNVVHAEHSRSVGLFTIPEYPELELERGMWSTVLEVLLTTLRYLAPATLLTLFWGHQRFFFNALKYVDSAFRTLIFSSEEQKQQVIQWLSEVGPVRVDDLETVWRHGWIVCGVLDAALPGACAGHPPTRLSLKHAQAIADHYLGVDPMFTRQELEANEVLSKHEAWKLIKYLDRIRIAIAKLTPPSTTSKPITDCTTSSSTQFTLDYIARGSGLIAAQINNKMFFKIYPTAQQSLDPGEITIVIKGPKNIYGMSTLSPILGKAQMIRQTLLGLQSKPTNYTDNVLPVTQGATYLRNYGKNDMNKTYHIPKTQYDININVERNPDHVKIGYTVPMEGKYEISITSRGENIVGSPFFVTASKNIMNILEKDSFCLEDGEEIDIVDIKSDRKVVLRIVDFVTEKMLLKENGALERITEDEAKNLMELDSLENSINDDEIDRPTTVNDLNSSSMQKSQKFYTVATRILKMNRVCKALYNLDKEKSHNLSTDSSTGKQNDVPDVVNSTFLENQTTNTLSAKRERIIIPENISVSLFMDKSSKIEEATNIKPSSKDTNELYLQNLENIKMLQIPFDDDNMSTDTIQSTNNPFLNDIYDTTYTEKEFGSFITSEYETNNSQNEESHIYSNPFIDFKQTSKEYQETVSLNIDHGKDLHDNLSVMSDEAAERIEIIENEYINPFIVLNETEDDSEKLPVTDFIIGAPVSLPPVIGSPIKENTPSLNCKNDNKNLLDTFQFRKENENVSFISSQESLEQREEIPSISPFHSLGSDTYNFLSQSNLQRSRDISPKDLWDSAYVSIDDNASSPDNNNNNSDRSVSETLIKNNFVTSKEFHNPSNIDNRELWDGSEESEHNYIPEDTRNFRWEYKRPVFTPIIEETEKSLTSGMKENVNENETDTVSKAFAELNEIYNDIFPNPEESIASENEGSTLQNFEEEYIIENDNIRVDSASENSSDVKRHAGEIEGSISEIQANETESVSASRDLHAEEESSNKSSQNNEETQFGDSAYSNIVLEKKRYWDEKIRQIEAKNSEESKLQQRRKRISAKHFKYNDSLSKRKGKQIVKNFLNSGALKQSNNNDNAEESVRINTVQVQFSENSRSDIKLVKKWKTYWDSKLEEENKEVIANSQSSCVSVISNIESVNTVDYEAVDEPTSTGMYPNVSIIENDISPAKSELPEEVFKAFETCPKRFFGTSRKHILNKIDSFLGKPTFESIPKTENISLSHETGLVSSRISLFHNISQTEELPWLRSHHKQNKSSTYNKHNSSTDSNKGTSVDPQNLQYENDKQEAKDEEFTEMKQVERSEDETSTNISLEKGKSIESNIEKETESNLQQGENNDIQHQTNTPDNDIPSPVTENHIVQDLRTDNVQRKVKCRKLKSFSKSEMDIFSKISTSELTDDFDKRKSVEELPRINVKNFISLYEDVSKSTQSELTKYNQKTVTNRKIIYNSSSSPGTPSKSHYMHSASKHFIRSKHTEENETISKQVTSPNPEAHTRCSSVQSTHESIPDNEKKYISLSDIELEIVDKQEEKHEPCATQKPEETLQVDYKSRFKMAKQYFQSLEELRDVKNNRKVSECKIIVNGRSTESLDENGKESKEDAKSQKIKSKSDSMPSSEISKIVNEIQGETNQDDAESRKLVKISEKFNVEDLFEDVMEGRLSRQGSLRGIPHKKAVLETFKSMENVSDNKLNSYELAVSQVNDFSHQSQTKNAQTYLSEYPYLPTTDPSKFQSRFDASASGLISYNELLKSRPRRNSVPDIRLNPSFTENL
ncbi:uncharacterized protein LOC119839095 [Zerene cesonia]|uniref:uncharacterized protein LOC119839095 n=1 Tax=Zerene cesonia TaxID=33412 RepID=UPI0018E4DF2B|nr:uncharacterized protein LOC119839095 [Zerene cesonia]